MEMGVIAEAVLFDLDGVLVDACEWHYISLNKALFQVVGKKISRQDHITTYNGLPTKVKLKILGISELDAQKVWNLKQELTMKTIDENSCILDEKIELHLFLKTNNIKVCCVTNSIRETAELMLKKTGQLEFMEFILANEDVENNKPHPDCYNLAVEMMDANPKNVIIVEDSQKGIQAAIASVAENVWEVDNPSKVTLENYKRYIDENFNTNGR